MISATGARDLFSSPQPVTENPVRTLTLKGALRGLPADGVGRDQGSASGEGFPPQNRKCEKTQIRKLVETTVRNSDSQPQSAIPNRGYAADSIEPIPSCVILREVEFVNETVDGDAGLVAEFQHFNPRIAAGITIPQTDDILPVTVPLGDIAKAIMLQ